MLSESVGDANGKGEDDTWNTLSVDSLEERIVHSLRFMNTEAGAFTMWWQCADANAIIHRRRPEERREMRRAFFQRFEAEQSRVRLWTVLNRPYITRYCVKQHYLGLFLLCRSTSNTNCRQFPYNVVMRIAHFLGRQWDWSPVRTDCMYEFDESWFEDEDGDESQSSSYASSDGSVTECKRQLQRFAIKNFL